MIPVPLTEAEARRFAAKLRVDNGCLLWTGCTNSRGYGVVGLRGARFLTHRVAYETVIAPIPAGWEVDHLCRRRLCCTPAHLEAVSGAENRRRSRGTGTVWGWDYWWALIVARGLEAQIPRWRWMEGSPLEDGARRAWEDERGAA